MCPHDVLVQAPLLEGSQDILEEARVAHTMIASNGACSCPKLLYNRMGRGHSIGQRQVPSKLRRQALSMCRGAAALTEELVRVNVVACPVALWQQHCLHGFFGLLPYSVGDLPEVEMLAELRRCSQGLNSVKA